MALAGFALPAQAQLISPGALSRVHQDLEGIRQCTSCHTLGNKGIDNARCLACHTPLKTRVDAGRGFHASVTGRDCAECHKEHFGETFQLVRFDTTQFDHEETGFRLADAHNRVACGTCHRASRIAAADVRAFKGRHGALDRTFLGLGTRCLSCHEPDSPHAGQFEGDDCATCHSEDRWEKAERFEHDDARFALTGQHRQAACQACHPQRTTPGGQPFTRYEDIAFDTCVTCHDDAHRNAFGTSCATCHDPAGWHQVRNLDERRFNHRATGFDLVGRHARLACEACHTARPRRDGSIRVAFVRGTEGHTYPRIQVADCQSCHVDEHDRVFAETEGGANCTNCHTEGAWTPVTYDLDRHNQATRFALTGAHLATPCTACHHAEGQAVTFRFAGFDCATCHEGDKPHGDQFADDTGTTTCADCHTTDGWISGDDFDHARTAYALTGRHLQVDCAACHPRRSEEPALYRGLATDCRSCHRQDDPHQGQFDGQTCETCHDTDGFPAASTRFDHRRTRFPLDGAHREAQCGQCHRTESAPDGASFLRYRPLTFACKDCHRDG